MKKKLNKSISAMKKREIEVSLDKIKLLISLKEENLLQWHFIKREQNAKDRN
jgi:hypothetical protein